MNIPGFTAEDSVYRTTQHYYAAPSGSLRRQADGLTPQAGRAVGGTGTGVSSACVGACALSCAAACIFSCTPPRGTPWSSGCESCVDTCMDRCAVNCVATNIGGVML
jgi:hypothetical protein